MRIDPDTTLIAYKQQAYTCIGIEDYQRLDGLWTELAVLASNCMDCGVEFLCKVSRHTEKLQPNRRCEAHKRGFRRRSRKSPAQVPHEVPQPQTAVLRDLSSKTLSLT